jgi:excisionase family DNA binding protein
MSMTPSCGFGHNGGPLLDDLEPLAGVFSLTINQATKRTGLSRSRIYRYLDAGRLRSFKVGKARLIIAESLRQLLTELATPPPEGAPPLPPRRPGGRFAPSPKENDENAGVPQQRVKEFST